MNNIDLMAVVKTALLVFLAGLLSLFTINVIGLTLMGLGVISSKGEVTCFMACLWLGTVISIISLIMLATQRNK